MVKKKILLSLLSFMVMGTLSMGAVDAAATITPIAPPANAGATRFGIQFDDGNGHEIRMLNRNLGSKVAGTGEDSYGYFYQWGNNNGFNIQNGTGSIPLYEVSESETNMGANLVQWNDSYDAHGFYGLNFIKSTWEPYGGDLWKDSNNNSSNHENVWGGGWDYENGRGGESYNSIAGRKGPCPEGTHIPSQAERDNLIKYYVQSYDDRSNVLDLDASNDYGEFVAAFNNLAIDFANDFKLPYGGYIDADKKTNSQGIEYRDAGVLGYYWSSSPNSRVDPTSRVFILGANMLWNQSDSMRIQGYNIRCFYDDSVDEYTGSLTISFDSKGGNYTPDSQTVSYNGIGSEPTEPTKEGYTFGGWYEKKVTEQFDFDAPITRNVKLYARRNIVTNATVSSIAAPWAGYNGTKIDGIEFDDGNGYSVKILDRNMGATGVNSYGYHYQWGNNYGFEGSSSCPAYNGSSNRCFDGMMYRSSPICYDYDSNAQRYYNWYDHRGLNQSYFIKSVWDPYRLDYWNDSDIANHEALRGGEGDYDNDWGLTSTNDVTWRQGPCPKGYHVPSQGERNELFTHWWMAYSGKYEDYDGITYYEDDYGSKVVYSVDNNEIIQDFKNDFNITFDGYRDGEDGSVKGQGDIGYYWTSSPNSLNEALTRKFTVTPTGIYSNSDSARAYGYSVRCFYNPEPVKYRVYFYYDSQVSSISCIEGEGCEGEIPTVYSNEAYNFDGWNFNGQIYSNVTTDMLENFIKYPNGGLYYQPSDIYLYAQKSPIRYNITYFLNNGVFSPNDSVVYSYTANYGDITLNTPIRTGYDFVGWNGTDIDGISQSVTIPYGSVGNRTYRANWEAIEYTLTVDLGNGTTQTITGYYGDPIDVPQDPTRDGYSFAGWSITFPTTMPAENQTITAQWTATSYNIGYELNEGELSGTDTNPVSYTIITDTIILKNPVKTGHNFLGWSGTDIDGISQSVTILSGNTGNRYYEANWEAIEYTLTVDLGNGMTQTITGHYGDPIDVPQDPTRDGYSFAGWSTIFPTTMPAENQTITAQWTKNQTPQSYGGGGGGGGSSRVKDNCPNGDFSNNYYDGKCGEKVSTGRVEDGEDGDDLDEKRHNAAEEVEYDILKFDPNYSDEMNQAYQYSYAKGITTMDSIDKADMRGSLTRVAMAKMLSKYAINVLGMTPDVIKQNKFVDVPDSLDAEYDSGVTLAYQLGIMGQNMGDKFRPYDLVPRSEFVTALSRMKYNTPDGKYAGTSEFYKNHMDLLEKLGIVTNTDSTMLEVRGYVMIMLMRSK